MMKTCHEPRVMNNPTLYTRSILRKMGGERKKEKGTREEGRQNFIELFF